MVILYQIGIFIAIQIAAVYGRSSRNTAVVLIAIFTLLQVYISPLLLLQIITIIFSYNYSNKYINNPKNTTVSSPEVKKVKEEKEDFARKIEEQNEWVRIEGWKMSPSEAQKYFKEQKTKADNNIFKPATEFKDDDE